MPPIWLYTNKLDSSTARLKICVEYWPVCSAHHYRVNVECGLCHVCDNGHGPMGNNIAGVRTWS